MKTFIIISIALLGLATCIAQSQEAPYEVIQRGPYFRQWQRVVPRALPDGGRVDEVQSYTELASGMHFWKDNQWIESREEILPVDDGATAEHGQYQAHFKSTPAVPGALTLTLPDGRKMRSHVLALAYTDRASGQSVLLGQPKDCLGEIIPRNQVIYVDAFDDVKADIRYTYRRGGLSQDIVLRENLPAPEEFGLNSENVLLEVLTEFIETPQPVVKVLGAKSRQKDALPSAEPGITDVRLDFGSMQVAEGRAFVLGQGPSGRTQRVYKSWEQIEGRQFLIESVQYSRIKAALSRLPQTAAVDRKNPTIRGMAQNGRPIPRRRAAGSTTKPLQFAASHSPRPGYLLDYEILLDTSDFTFYGTGTYVLSGPINFSGTTVIEGGAVIKYRKNEDAKIIIIGSLECHTSPYRMAIFTAVDDSSVGANVATATLSGYYATEALSFPGGSAVLKHLRFLHAERAITTVAALEAWDLQFRQCNSCVFSMDSAVHLYNALAYNFGTLIDGDAYYRRVEHLTARIGNYLWNPATMAGLELVNCLVFAVPVRSSNPPIPEDNVLWLANDPGAFQAAGCGYHYLPANSPYRIAGSSAEVSPDLLEVLRQRTTHLPERIVGTIGTSTTWRPGQARRYPETGPFAPDLGYHYPLIDYSVSGAALAPGVTLRVEPGVAIALDFQNSSWGFKLDSGARFISEGIPLRLNVLSRASLIHEMAPLQPGSRAWFYDYGDVNPSRPVDSELRFRFTELNQLVNDSFLLYSGFKIAVIEWSHCRHFNGWIALGISSAASQVCALTNSLFEKPSIYRYTGASPQTFSFVACNNLFRGKFYDGLAYGNMALEGSAMTWTARDNLFDGMYFYNCTASGANTHNALYDTTGTWPLGDGNLPLPSLGYETGPLGNFYEPDGSALKDAGSRTAAEAGLYHFTAQVAQIKEGSSSVDIGLHYTAMSDSSELLRADFENGDLAGWTVVDEGNVSAPSDWKILSGKLRQDSNVFGPDVSSTYNRKGTFAYWNHPEAAAWSDYTYSVVLNTADDDGIGVMFRYQSAGNYYKLDLDKQRNFRKLFKVVNGLETTLASEAGGYVQNSDMVLQVTLQGNQITATLNGSTLFGGPVTDPSLSFGTVALYCWGSQGLTFDNVQARASSPSSFKICDTDEDGWPDYLEDVNGNGQQESGETGYLVSDSDGDRLPDGWELFYGLNALSALGNDGGVGDPDFDGVLNLQENIRGRSPKSAGTVPDTSGTFVNLRVFRP